MAYLRELVGPGGVASATAFDDDLRSLGLPARAELLARARRLPSDELLDVTTVLARAADRAAMALPNAVRRIERAQRIGLGTTDEPMKGTR